MVDIIYKLNLDKEGISKLLGFYPTTINEMVCGSSTLMLQNSMLKRDIDNVAIQEYSSRIFATQDTSKNIFVVKVLNKWDWLRNVIGYVAAKQLIPGHTLLHFFHAFDVDHYLILNTFQDSIEYSLIPSLEWPLNPLSDEISENLAYENLDALIGFALLYQKDLKKENIIIDGNKTNNKYTFKVIDYSHCGLTEDFFKMYGLPDYLQFIKEQRKILSTLVHKRSIDLNKYLFQEEWFVDLEDFHFDTEDINFIYSILNNVEKEISNV